MKNKVKILQRANQTLEVRKKQIFNMMNKVFTKNQIKILLETSKQVRWTNEELSLAFTLRYLSKRAYIFVKRSLKVPLPSLACLKRWASTIDMTYGVLTDFLKLMQVAASKMTEQDKVCTVTFD